MVLAELTDPTAVNRAMDEFDRLGRDAFLRKYGFGRSRNYFVERNGNLYDSKAIAGVAYGIEHPDRGPLRPRRIHRGRCHGPTKIEELGFVVRAREPEPSEPFSDIMRRVLELQRSYSSSNTPEMQLRGRLVTARRPTRLQRLLSDPPPYRSNLISKVATGGDQRRGFPGLGLRQAALPEATSGWYVVYLFAADGSAVYLSLNQGTTTFEDGSFRSRPPAYLQQRVSRRVRFSPREETTVCCRRSHCTIPADWAPDTSKATSSPTATTAKRFLTTSVFRPICEPCSRCLM